MSGPELLLAYGIWVAIIVLALCFLSWRSWTRKVNAEWNEQQRQQADRRG